MKIPAALLVFVFLFLPQLAKSDDVSNPTQPPAASPEENHGDLKLAPSATKDVPAAVLEAKKKFATEKRALDQQIKQVVAQFGPNSPEAENARSNARAQLAELRKQIEIARREVARQKH